MARVRLSGRSKQTPALRRYPRLTPGWLTPVSAFIGRQLHLKIRVSPRLVCVCVCVRLTQTKRGTHTQAITLLTKRQTHSGSDSARPNRAAALAGARAASTVPSAPHAPGHGTRRTRERRKTTRSARCWTWICFQKNYLSGSRNLLVPTTVPYIYRYRSYYCGSHTNHALACFGRVAY